MKKALFIATLAALSLCGCNFSSKIKDMTSLAKEEMKAQHEYRDSEKWGKVVEKDINITDFSSIQIGGAVDIVFTQGDSCSVRALGNEKAIENYQFFLNDNELVVNLEGFSWEKGNKNITQDTPAITVFITAPSLNGITLYGAGDISVADSLSQTENLSIDVYGAGDINLKFVSINNLAINISGAGDVSIKDATCLGNAKFSVQGAGDIDSKVKCANAAVSVKGAGDVDLDVECNELTAECLGAGDIKLKGECNVLRKKEGPIGGIDSRKLEVKNKTTIK